MVNKIIYTLFFLLSVLYFDTFAKENQMPDIFLSYDKEGQSFYEHQDISVTLTLYSSTPDITYARKIDNFKLSKGEFDSFHTLDGMPRSYKKVMDGKTFYCFPIETYIVSFANKGTFEVPKRNFNVGVSFPIIVNDPFWGRIRSTEVENFEVTADKYVFKVKALPKVPSNFVFSGAIGQFKIETVVPKGDIFANEEATAYIILKGSGMLSSSVLPEYRSAFSDGVKLKSVSESQNQYFENGKLMNEIRLECTFIPQNSSHLEIRAIDFGFFNPETGKYVTVSSKPVIIDVKSSVSKRESISI